MVPGLASTMPRSTSSFLVPRKSTPTLSPALALSSSLRNISMSVATVLRVSFKPTISTSDIFFNSPRSTRPVTTVPAAFNVEHVFDAHQERLVHFARWQRNEAVHRAEQVLDGFETLRRAAQGGRGAARE